jgi:integrase
LTVSLAVCYSSAKGDTVMALTDTAIKTAKPKATAYKLADEKGLYVLVKKAGKYFRLDYRFAGKRKTLALGVYPEVSLKEAREKRDEARKLISNNLDPVTVKKAKKLELVADGSNTFKAVAVEWCEKMKSKWSADHAGRKWHYIEKDVFPTFAATPIKDITARELLPLLEKIQGRGAIDVAHRVKGICGEIFRYGVYTGRCDRDPTQDIKGVLTPQRNKHMATITDPKGVGGLLRAIDDYQGDFVTKGALKLTPYVMLRPGELRHAEWSEIDLGKKQWKISAEKMKMGRPHIVPLSNQAVEIFKTMQPITGQGKYVFPSVRSKDRPMSENTITAALRRMGFTKEEITAHGFRGMASTLLHENGFKSEVIEAQLAHAERNKVKAAYNHAEYLAERAEMMQKWADYLDSLK